MNIENTNLKPIKDMADDEKFDAIYSARYIFEDMFYDGTLKQELEKLTGFPEGVINVVINNIFKQK
jgi:hypothetical protein